MPTNRKKLYALGGVFIAIITALIALVILPVFYRIENSSQNLIQKKREAELFLKNWRDLENSKGEYEIIQKTLKDYSIYLPTSQAIKFIQMLEAIAQQTKNRQTITITEDKNPSEKESETLNFQISLWGNFPNLINFLLYLENSEYYNNVNSIRIVALTEKNEQGNNISPNENINTVISLSVYQKNE